MPQTKAMVIYDVPSAQVRRIIVAEDDAAYDTHHTRTVGPGENYTFINFKLGEDPQFRSGLAKAQDAVTRVTGRFPSVF
jgi:hypothetical protein